MSAGTAGDADTEMVRAAVRSALLVHPRVLQQGFDLSTEQRAELASTLPQFLGFENHRFETVTAVLDWDHQLPSKFAVLRVYANYRDHSHLEFETQLQIRNRAIARDNIYPEFDVPDLGELHADESYAFVLPVGLVEVQETRFLSAWRRHVEAQLAHEAIATVQASEAFAKLQLGMATPPIGGPIVIGWAPPCLSLSGRWAIEIWVVTEFNGQFGHAHGFMVDATERRVVREFETDIQLA